MPTPGPRTTPRYSAQFKVTAVRLSQMPGVAMQDVAQSLYIHPFLLSRWRKQAREGAIVTKGVAVDKQVQAELKERRRVKKAYEQLKLEHDLSKRAIAFTSELTATSSLSSQPAGACGASEVRCAGRAPQGRACDAGKRDAGVLHDAVPAQPGHGPVLR